MKKGLCKILALLLPVMLLTACGQTPQAAPETTQAPTVEAETETTPAEDLPLVDACADGLLRMVPQPVYGPIGGEWSVIGLSRWEGTLPESWIDCYWDTLISQLKASSGVLHERKYTEYSRVILALTAIGKDPADVEGYNLLEPLADYEQTIFQGINGPAFALLALDSGSYEIPVNTVGSTQATRELYVDYILGMEAPNGGWGLSGGEADVDITAMVLQALANYRDQGAVAEAAERAFTWLSQAQNHEGGFTSFNSESSESVSQVIVALTQWGIGMEDPRFVKNGNTLQDRLLDFMTDQHQFRHTLDGEGDLMATEQAFLALAALDREAQGKSGLYHMTPEN